MLGNPDMHLKNLGLVYPDGRTPVFAPAYDIVAYAAYHPCQGHGLRLLPAELEPRGARRGAAAKPSGRPVTKPGLSPSMLRAFCAHLGIPEKPAAKAVGDCVKAAQQKWPGLLRQATLTARQQENLLAHFGS